LISPSFNWWKFIGDSAGRSELAAEYYDKILFEDATFGDLLGRPGPVAIATGTDISTGSRLAFYQNDFDLLCSDLEPVRLSRAAATSSAAAWQINSEFAVSWRLWRKWGLARHSAMRSASATLKLSSCWS
jgi:hypothetical protein